MAKQPEFHKYLLLAEGAAGLVIITGFDNAGAQAAYRASGCANWALAMEKRFSNE